MPDPSPPVAVANRLVSTARTSATTITESARPTPARNLASTIRDRFGSRVKVTSPLRWLDSLVTNMITMIGRK